MVRTPWLYIIGIGDNGLDSLSGQATRLFEAAETVIAPARVLEEIETGDRDIIPWTFGVSETIKLIKQRRGTPATILATGDPMHFGIGATLRRFFDADEMVVVPSPSGFSLAASKMGWALQDTAQISLHGRAVEGLHTHLVPKAKILSLTSNERTIFEVAKLLVARGFGSSQVTVLEHIGGECEKITAFKASEISAELNSFADFNILAIACESDISAPVLSRVPGLADDAFEHDGQLTKREVRSVVLSFLMPYQNAVLWDIGAGCGSVSIEWMRSSHGACAIAIEENTERCDMILANAKNLGVPKLQLIQGEAPASLEGLQKPDAIFIGGGLTDKGVFDACWSALDEGKPLVANAVTVESEAKLIALHEKYGGELVRMQIARAVPVGRFSGWKPFMPVTIWSVLKGANS
ncbi:precorrin-6y C5,15-methyltransferase (decarboxylating) subunit CbiE [Lentilitoribacter sp. Alg239-R112]|uniref:precorrin-6y C5,15-methyltransferase (decarboxylating) subunit CbiE n=1 Tax=Lentilitoribacter sp. Alg239-R112 TaxID=2305987 RepID=UPI0013A70207|nr:precorrin-6y C5,15-methyltransferase (decarboxylating) subunit CbiE [Lentilitoribacter sp. Alg239-R112]